MSPLVNAWLQFAACAAVIAVAGANLSRYGDVIAEKSGVSRSWVGLVLLATVTSLPELVTGVAAVAIAAVPNIAAGDVLGSCVFNLAILVVVDYLHRNEPVYRRARQGHILSAGFGVVMIGFVGLNLLLGGRIDALSLGHVGIYTPAIVLLYAVAIRAVFHYEREELRAHVHEETLRYPHMTLRQAATRYAVAALCILAAGTWLPFAGAELARVMGWHGTFVGTLFVAGATSLPELAVTVVALRIGAVDMAIANLLGSNLFNIVVLAVDDLFYLPGPLLSHVSPMHAMSAITACVMSGVVIVALLYRPGSRVLRTVGWASVCLVVLYLLNAYVLYLHGE